MNEHLLEFHSPSSYSHSGYRMLTLHEAVNMLDNGVKFGQVYEFLQSPETDGPQLKYYFTHRKLPEGKLTADNDERLTPINKSTVRKPSEAFEARKPRVVTLTSLNGVTGEVCPQCQGSNVVRDGKCSKCMDCYSSIGACS